MEPEEIGPSDRIDSPFDPTQININTRPSLVDQLLDRIQHDEIDLEPEFQRNSGIWTDEEKSRLIESLLIRIPIPAFYFDATNDDRWIVIDGLQRLTVFKEFVLDKSLKLSGLEFLKQFSGAGFDDLPRPFQRRIGETQLTVFLIDRPTPPDVKFILFRRINTGGSVLSAQEIRHALNPGPAVAFLKQLAESSAFVSATDRGVGTKRMDDRECVLRVLAFILTPYREYRGEFHVFLNQAMQRLNSMSEHDRQNLRMQFEGAMVTAKAIFGEQAFRKPSSAVRRSLINKALLEAWGANLTLLNPEERATLEKRKADVQSRCATLMTDASFLTAISQSTGKVSMVQTRFARVAQVIQEVLQGDR